ncbi:MAG: helix-turn-helix domain-containing protein [Salinibacterium sp.]|nr:helix-turn-helix domain-containing protein [Salinibacterium sp.]MBF0673277.1 helix-turn-helix domain-containing protein [Salinibacterium sp.]
MEASSERRVVALTSAKQMRALAHPLRMRLLGELRVEGPLTVGRLCEIVDEAPGNVSYHMGKLAEFGFVEEAPELATDRRERWWRAAHDFTRVVPPAEDAADEEVQASLVMRHQVIDSYAATLHAALDASARQPREWAEAAGTSDTVVHLTAEQLAEVSAELHDVLRRWEERSDRTRDGAHPVQLIVSAVRRP